MYQYNYSWLSLSRIRWDHGKNSSQRSSTREELWKYRKCSLFNDERETTRSKFWRAKTSIACPDSRNDFKLIRCFVAVFFSLLNSLNLVERLITSRYLFFTPSLDSHNCVIFNLIRFSVWLNVLCLFLLLLNQLSPFLGWVLHWFDQHLCPAIPPGLGPGP